MGTCVHFSRSLPSNSWWQTMVGCQVLSRPSAAEGGGRRPAFTGPATQPYSATEVGGWQQLSRVSQNRAAVHRLGAGIAPWHGRCTTVSVFGALPAEYAPRGARASRHRPPGSRTDSCRRSERSLRCVAGGIDRARRYAAELVALASDVIFASGAAALAVAVAARLRPGRRRLHLPPISPAPASTKPSVQRVNAIRDAAR